MVANQTLDQRGILFVSILPNQWGGSELLWSETALLLATSGFPVSVSVGYQQPEPAVLKRIENAGGFVYRRNAPQKPAPMANVCERVRRWMLRKIVSPTKPWTESDTVSRVCPALTVISQPSCIEGIEWMETCIANGIPFVTIAQACSERLFENDDLADSIGNALLQAKKSFFVSRANQSLLESFIGKPISYPEIVRNPFQVPYDVVQPWPTNGSTLRLACVARLHMMSKGQDILLRVLSNEKWRNRELTVSFFGSGPNERSFKNLAVSLGLKSVTFNGHTSDVAAIWREHHGLILPSRYEGLPIALVEAMLSGRPAIVTNVSGNCEVMIDGETGFVAAAPQVDALDLALERLWQSRDKLNQLGSNAACHIRKLVPQSPASDFAERLKQLASI